MSLEFEAEVFAWEGEGGWHFARLPREVADDVREMPSAEPRGFGSVRVSASIGATTWQTSLFPEKTSGSFLMPVKKSVRVAEGIRTDDVVLVRIAVEGEA